MTLLRTWERCANSSINLLWVVPFFFLFLVGGALDVVVFVIGMLLHSEMLRLLLLDDDEDELSADDMVEILSFTIGAILGWVLVLLRFVCGCGGGCGA